MVFRFFWNAVHAEERGKSEAKQNSVFFCRREGAFLGISRLMNPNGCEISKINTNPASAWEPLEQDRSWRRTTYVGRRGTRRLAESRRSTPSCYGQLMFITALESTLRRAGGGRNRHDSSRARCWMNHFTFMNDWTGALVLVLVAKTGCPVLCRREVNRCWSSQHSVTHYQSAFNLRSH